MASLARFWNSEKSVKLFRIWWTRGDSNPRPPRCERGALPAELLAHEQQPNFSKRPARCQSAISPVHKKGVQHAAPLFLKRFLKPSFTAGRTIRPSAAPQSSAHSGKAPAPAESRPQPFAPAG